MDFHCHLDLYPHAAIFAKETAQRNEFTWLVTTSPRGYEATSKVLGELPKILITPGLHPELVETRSGELPLLLEQMKKVNAVGEVGIDGSYRFKKSLPLQKQVFEAVVSHSQSLGGRVLSIHSRGAVKDVLSTLLKHPGFGTAVLHWFNGNLSEMKTADAMGCWFSLGPAALSTSAGCSIATRLPRDKVVPESDGPFATENGAPVPPWSMQRTAQLLAPLWGYTETQALTMLESNSKRLLQNLG